MGTWECISCLLKMLSADVHIVAFMLERDRGYPILEVAVFPILALIVDVIKQLREFIELRKGKPNLPYPQLHGAAQP